MAGKLPVLLSNSSNLIDIQAFKGCGVNNAASFFWLNFSGINDMETLLVCTDFSKAAFHAAEYACMLARRYNFQRITLFHAYQTMVPTTDLPVVAYNSSELYNTIQEQLKDLGKKIGELAGTEVNIKTRAEELVLGENLNAICREEDVCMVVMGISEKSGFEKMLVGSNVVKVSESSKFPVLIVPVDAAIQPINRVLLACDLDKIAETTPLDTLDMVLQLFDAQLVVVNVDDGNRNFTPKTTEEIYHLHHIFDRHKPEYAFTEGKDIAKGVLDYAKENNISLIITIPRYYNFLRHLFHKSTTKRLVYNSKLPLLTLHE